MQLQQIDKIINKNIDLILLLIIIIPPLHLYSKIFIFSLHLKFNAIISCMCLNINTLNLIFHIKHILV